MQRRKVSARQRIDYKSSLPSIRVKALIVVSKFIIIAGLIIYGAWQGRNHLIVPPCSLGTPVQVVGTVTSVSTKKLTTVHLIVDVVQANGQITHTSISCFYLVMQQRFATELTIGDVLSVSGSFVSDENTSPTPSLTAWLGKSYGLRGRTEHVTTNSSNLFQRLQVFIQRSISANLPSAAQANGQLLQSIVFGGSQTSTADYNLFLKSGVLHILAASGANLTIISKCLAVPIWIVARFLPWRTISFRLLMLAVDWGFIELCGLGPSLLRAGWMSTYNHLAGMAHRQPSLRYRLTFAVICMSLLNPSLLWSAGAILSFVATSAILLANSVLFPRHLHRRSRTSISIIHTICAHILRDLGIGLVIESMTIPLTLGLFGQWSPYGILTNLLVDPLLILLLPSAMIWTLCSLVATIWPLFFPIFSFVSSVTLIEVNGIRRIISWIANWPHSLVVWKTEPMWALCSYYAVLVTVCWLISFYRQRNAK